MAKPWERPWSMEEIIENSDNWSLAGDVALLNTLKAFADSVLHRVGELNDNVTDLTSNLDQAALQLEISQNKFRSLRNTQFIESRVYEDDETLNEVEPAKVVVAKENAEKEDHSEQIKSAVDKGLAVLDKYFEKVEVANSDSEDDNDFPSFVLRPKDPYIDRPLPYVIGTEEWHKSWHVGLEDSSSDSGTEKNSDDEKFSETDSESDLPVLDRSQIKGISDTTSGSSESEFVTDRNKPVTFGKNRQEPEEEEQKQQQPEEIFQDPAGSLSSRDNFARTLAAKLGDVITNHNQENNKLGRQKNLDSNRFPENEVVNTRPLQKDKPPAGKFSDNLFFDEPPPLIDETGGGGGKFSGGHGLFDDEDDEAEEDDWSTKAGLQAKKSTVLKKGGLFDDDDDVTDEEDSIFAPKKSILYPPSNVMPKPPLFYDEPPALDHAEIAKPKPSQKTERSEKPKKPQEPVKKLSLFDSDDDIDTKDKKTEGLFGEDDTAADGEKEKPKAKKPTGGVSMLGGGLFDKKLLLRRPTSSSDDEEREENVQPQDKPKSSSANVLKRQSSSEDDGDGKESEEKHEQKKDIIKKPIGGVSILGATANVFDKKLLLRRRQSSSDDEDKHAETTKDAKRTEAKSKIDRLFSSSDEDHEQVNKNTFVVKTDDNKKAKKPTVAKRKPVMIEEKRKVDEKKKVSLFDDEVDTAITVKKTSEKKKFNLFDDDDLFKDDLFSSKPSAITKSLTSSLFDDDDMPEVDDKKSEDISKPVVSEQVVQKESKPKSLFDDPPPQTDNLFSSKSMKIVTTEINFKIPEPAKTTTFGAPPPPSEEPPEDTFVDTESDTRMSSGLFDSPPPDTDFDDLFNVPTSSDDFVNFGDITRTIKKSDLFGGESYDDLFIPKIQSHQFQEKNSASVFLPKGDGGHDFTEIKGDLFDETNDKLFVPKSQSTPAENIEQQDCKTPCDVLPKLDDVTKDVTRAKPKEDDVTRTKPKVDDVTKSSTDDIGKADDDLTTARNFEDIVSKTTAPTSESFKDEETARKTSPGKLKHNLSINVGALMPGSAPPRSNLVKKSKSSEPLRDVDFVEPDVEVLHSVTKDRAKLPLRRQPSTRRGRQAALRVSSSDFKLNSQEGDGDSVAVTEKPPEKPLKVEADEKKIVEDGKKSLIDPTDGQEEQKAKPKKPVGGISILGASLDLDRKLLMRRQASEEKVVEDDLFEAKPSLIHRDEGDKKYETNDLFDDESQKTAAKSKNVQLFSGGDSEDRIKPKKPEEGSSITGASLDQKLFTRRPSSEKEFVKRDDKTKKPISLFDSDDENKSEDKEGSDLFGSGSNSKRKSYQKSAVPKKGEESKKTVQPDLFGDDEDDDDLFGGAKAPSKANKSKNRTTKKAPAKKSLFSDDDEDDIFQSSSSAIVKRPEPRQAVERKIPKSTKKLETPADDPLSDLLR